MHIPENGTSILMRNSRDPSCRTSGRFAGKDMSGCPTTHSKYFTNPLSMIMHQNTAISEVFFQHGKHNISITIQTDVISHPTCLRLEHLIRTYASSQRPPIVSISYYGRGEVSVGGRYCISSGSLHHPRPSTNFVIHSR